MYLVKKGLPVMLAVICIYVVYAVSSTWFACRRARFILQHVQTLTPGHSSFNDVKKFANLYGFRVASYASNCSPRACDWDYMVDNGRLANLYLFKPVSLGITIHLENTAVTAIEAGMIKMGWRWSRQGALLANTEYREFPLDQTERRPVVSTVYAQHSGKHAFRVITKVYRSATPNQRNKAFSFDLKCLYLPFLCGDARALMSNSPL